MDKTLCGAFYTRNGETVYGLMTVKHLNERIKLLQELDYFNSLAPDNLEKLSRFSATDIRRLVHLWRGIEDCLLTSTPELVNRRVTKLHKKLWHWITSMAIISYDNAVKEWKRFTLYIKHYASCSDELKGNPLPQSLPEQTSGRLSEVWFQTLPWLRRISLIHLGIPPRKEDLERVGHLAQTRVCPPPPLTPARFEKELKEWKEDLTRIPYWDNELARSAERACEKVVSFLTDKIETEPRPHVSVGGAATFRRSRTDGGKAIDFFQIFLATYVLSSPILNVTGETWFGAPYVVQIGVPLIYTMCRVVPLSTRVKYFLSSAFRSEMGSNTALDVMFSGENSKKGLEEPIFGLDEATAYQMLQLSIEKCIDAGYLGGSKHRNVLNPLRPTSKRIRARAHPVPEEGNKVRWVTMEDSFVSISLQPLAHFFAGVLRYLPSLVSAFTRTYKGWDVCVALQTQWKHGIEPKFGFGAFDLKGASNNLNKKFLKVIGLTIIRNFSPDGAYGFYLILFDLMLRDRSIYVYEDEGSREWFRTIVCTNGILMGNPGTKELLCLSSAVLHLIAFRDFKYVPYTLIAGDDVFVMCSLEMFNSLMRVHERYGNVIQMTKTIWSQICIFFCEEVIQVLAEAVGSGRAAWESYEIGLHVDTIKLRLLSAFGSSLDDNFKNPAIGKWGALDRVLEWYPRKGLAKTVKLRFLRRMVDFIWSDPLVFLPRSAGGHGLPWVYDPKVLLEWISTSVSPHYFAFWKCLKDSRNEFITAFDFLRKRMSTGLSVRGLCDPGSILLAGQFTSLAVSAFQDEVKTFSQLEAELKIELGRTVRGRDVVHRAKKLGLMNYANVVDDMDRLTAIRIGFAAANGSIPISDVVASTKERVPTPSMVFNKFIEDELLLLRRMSFDPKALSSTSDHYAEFREWLISGMNPRVLDKAMIYVPKRALIDSLNGLTTHIPFRAPQRLIPGSVEDRDLEPDAAGYTATIISLGRT